MGVIYLPVPSGESRGMASRFNAGRLAKGKAAHRVLECPDTGVRKWKRRLCGGGILTTVFPTQKLYLILHGFAPHNGLNAPAARVGMARDATRGRSLLQAADGTQEKLYTFEQLAEHCEQEGLSKGHCDLRLFMCSAGVAVPPPYGFGRSFAQEFREAMRRRGYGPLVVTGYLGDVTATYNHVLTTDAAEPRHPTMSDRTAGLFKGVQNAFGNMERASAHTVIFP